MKNNVLNILLIITLSLSTSVTVAGSNNGYTTAANIYLGSSSRGWYGGGVAYRLAEWRKEADKLSNEAKSEDVIEATSPSSETPKDNIAATQATQESEVETLEAPSAPVAPSSPNSPK